MSTLQTLYAMAAENPWWAWTALVIFWLCGVAVVLCLVAMLRRELPMAQWQDDDDQAKAITRPASLAGNSVIPWGRRVHTQADKQ